MSLGSGRLTLVDINHETATLRTKSGHRQRKHRYLVGSSGAAWRFVWDSPGTRRGHG
ncbi:MAG: hypothetical protein H7834_16285 [Magnetococcus sp. YQC-9]